MILAGRGVLPTPTRRFTFAKGLDGPAGVAFLALREEVDDLVFHCPLCSRRYRIRGYELDGTYRCRTCGGALEIEGGARPRSGATSRERRFGPYRLLCRVGEGGMGVVYRAEHCEAGQPVAIKVLRGELQGTEMLERFLREVQAIGCLDHPGIVGLLDGGRTDGRAWCAMDWVEGLPLTERLLDQLEVDDAIGLVVDLADAVAVAHLAGIIHRDLKRATSSSAPTAARSSSTSGWPACPTPAIP